MALLRTYPPTDISSRQMSAPGACAGRPSTPPASVSSHEQVSLHKTHYLCSSTYAPLKSMNPKGDLTAPFTHGLITFWFT